MELIELLKMQERVGSRSDFFRFLKGLQEVKKDHEQWSGLSTDDWLDGMITFVDALDESEELTWELVSDILLSGFERA